MFKLEKQSNKAVLTIYGYVGGYYLDYRNVSAALDEISSSGYKKLDFHIHTYGGAVIDGNLIYNFIASFKGEVDVYIDGVAASMGAIIILPAARIHIAENGFIMIHSPSGGAYGNARDLESTAKLLTSMEKNFRAKLMEKTGKTEEEVNAWFDGADHWIDADEAIASGLADDKFDSRTKDVPAIGKEELVNLGAKGVYNMFVACLNVDNQINNQMNKEDLIKRYSLTGVTAQSTDEEVLAAVDAKIAESASAAASEKKNAVAAIVDQAIVDKKITKEQRDSYISRGEKLGVVELTAVFADMKGYTPITSQIRGNANDTSTPDASRANWSFDDYQKNDPAALEALSKSNPEAFALLYKQKYGVNL